LKPEAKIYFPGCKLIKGVEDLPEKTKKPLISCEKYDEEDRKALIKEGQKEEKLKYSRYTPLKREEVKRRVF